VQQSHRYRCLLAHPMGAFACERSAPVIEIQRVSRSTATNSPKRRVRSLQTIMQPFSDYDTADSDWKLEAHRVRDGLALEQ
jgi:hypothetical protein